MHPLQTPSHLILLFGLGLLLGQQTKTQGNIINNLSLFIVLVISGLVIQNYLSINLNNELILLTLALIAGILVILHLNLPSIIMTTLIISGGIMLGLDTSPVIIPGIRSVSIYSWLSGSAVSIFTIISALILCSFVLHRFLEGMIIRVVGSWIATSALFVLTLFVVK